MRVAEAIETDAQTERELRTLSKGRRVEARVQQRARVILLAAQGWQNKEIAEEVKLDRRQVALWRRRFIDGGVQALLQDAARSGRTPSVTLAVESLIVSRTLHEQPAAAPQWSTRTLASDLGLSATTIRRVWQRNGIQPHVQDASAAENDAPRFEDMQIDVVGLYVNASEHALVVGCGEMPGHSRPGRTGTMAYDHWRKGTSALFKALKALDGTAISMRQDGHRHEDWLKFLRLIDRQAPDQLQLHLIVENHAIHENLKVQAWLARHPRLNVHLAPANALWLNMVKRFFRDVSAHRIQRDSLTHVALLQQAIAQHVERHGDDPRPFIWTAIP